MIVLWQAVTIAAVGVVIGAPLGVMLGRWVWEESIDQLGIVDTATVPWLLLAAVIAGALVSAAAVGIVTGWRATQRNAARALRDE